MSLKLVAITWFKKPNLQSAVQHPCMLWLVNQLFGKPKPFLLSKKQLKLYLIGNPEH